MITRRQFVQASLSVALVPAFSRVTFASTQIWTRPSWQTFCTGPLYQTFLDTIATMRANKNEADSASWRYWGNVHMQFCPHGKPYFLAWHRGLLKRFEMQLRHTSGNNDMVVPYWDYYTDPNVPPEFLDSTTSLWRGDRTGTNVYDALTLDPFSDQIVNLPRGEDNAYEPAQETAPHNPVHNLIGGRMADVALSPLDPLFWVHHANIDRLWKAWCSAGNGRTMPDITDPYWDGVLQYGAAVRTVDTRQTYTTEGLHYRYEDETMPTALPMTPSSRMASTQTMAAPLPSRPETTQTVVLGKGQALALDEHSISIEVPLTPQQQTSVRSLMLKPAANVVAPAKPDDSIRIVLDDVRLTGLGEKGGYFYRIYVNLPEDKGMSRPEGSYLLGMLGAYEMRAARMNMSMASQGASGMHASNQPLQMVYPVTGALRQIWPDDLSKLTISFVRASGSNNPAKGKVITAKEFRVETTAN